MATKNITDQQVCEAFAAYKGNGLPFADSRLRAATGEPEKVCYSAMERAYRRGLIECGVSLRSGWLTDKGAELLASGVALPDGGGDAEGCDYCRHPMFAALKCPGCGRVVGEKPAASLHVQEHARAGELNQCDGCMQGAELRNGLHYDRHGKVFMGCEREKYAASVQSHREEGESEQDAARALRKAMGISQDFSDWPLATLMLKAAGRIATLSAPVPADGGRDQREQLKVAVSLLRECIGPLEVSAAVIESDDGEEMEALIGRVRKFVKDADALAAAPSVSLPVADCGVERDAARYRWLRAQSWHDGPLCVLRDPKMVLTRGSGLGADCPSLDRLDAAIDAALAVPKDSGAPHEEGGVVTGGEVDRG